MRSSWTCCPSHTDRRSRSGASCGTYSTQPSDEIPHGTKTPEQALTDIDNTINKDLEEAGFFS